MNENYGCLWIILNAHCMAGSLAHNLLGPYPGGSQFLLGRRRVITEHPRPHRKFAIDSLNIGQSVVNGARDRMQLPKRPVPTLQKGVAPRHVPG